MVRTVQEGTNSPRYEQSKVRKVQGRYEQSMVRTVQEGTNSPRTVRTVQGTNSPSMVRIVQGTNSPRYEKSRYQIIGVPEKFRAVPGWVYTPYSQKNPVNLPYRLFTARSYAQRGIAMTSCPSVRLSVRPSVCDVEVS